MAKKNIVLAGFMASGKTTVGELLSEIAGKKLVDTDALIEEETGLKVREIFEGGGEAHFRNIECRVIERVSTGEELVIAVGGGAVLDPVNVSNLKMNGVIYILKVEPEDVMRRAQDDARPLLGKEEDDIEKLLRERDKAYRGAADVMIDTSRKAQNEIAREIADDFDVRTGAEA